MQLRRRRHAELLSPCPPMDRADANSQRVQAPGGNHEANAVEYCALAGRKFGSVRMSVKDGEESHQRCRETEQRLYPQPAAWIARLPRFPWSQILYAPMAHQCTYSAPTA